MSCCKQKSGQTSLVSLIPVVEGTPVATLQTYAVDLQHFLCRNRCICITAQYPLSGTMQAQVKGISLIGTSTYSVTIQLIGSISYLPYVCGCNSCDICPVSETVFETITVPVFSDTGTPTITLDPITTVLVSPTNVKDCCLKTNAVEIEFALAVNSEAA